MHPSILALMAAVAISSSHAYVVLNEADHYGAAYQPIPVMYVVDMTKDASCVEGTPTKTLNFVAKMCDANKILYNGSMVNISLNTPYAEWNPDIGDVLYSVAHAGSKVLGTNGDISDQFTWQQQYNFTYSKTYGDIFISVTTGTCSGSLAYGMTLSFSDLKPENPLKHIEEHSLDRNKYTESDLTLKFMQILHGVKYESLEQVFRLKVSETKTKHCNLYKLAYCFGVKPKYNVTIAVIAVDDNSGFGTYVCPYTRQDHKHNTCPQQKAFNDNSGAPANLVTADIGVDDKVAPILVRVCGNGRYEGENHFLMSSTGPRHETY